jgi:hypothetical protein
MPTRLEQFRTQYPQYDDIDDETLTSRLHERFYSDMEKDTFQQRLHEQVEPQPTPGQTTQPQSAFPDRPAPPPGQTAQVEDAHWMRWAPRQTPSHLRYGYDSPEVASIIAIESSGRPDAVGPIINPETGERAYGLMQILADTAAQPGFHVEPVDPGDQPMGRFLLENPEHNLRMGTDLFNAWTERYDNDVLGAMAYVWGPGNVDNWLAQGRPVDSEGRPLNRNNEPIQDARDYVRDYVATRNHLYETSPRIQTNPAADQQLPGESGAPEEPLTDEQAEDTSGSPSAVRRGLQNLWKGFHVSMGMAGEAIPGMDPEPWHERAAEIAADIEENFQPPESMIPQLEEFSELEGFWETVQFLATNPGFTASLTGESFGQYGPAVAAGLAAGPITGALGASKAAATGLGIGAYYSTGHILGAGQAIEQSIFEAGLDIENPEDIARAWEDPELRRDMFVRAQIRGVPIGAMSAVGVGLGGKFFQAIQPRTLPGGAGVGALETAAQGVYGAVGEGTAQLLETGYKGEVKIHWPDIATELVVQGFTGPADIAVGMLNRSGATRWSGTDDGQVTTHRLGSQEDRLRRLSGEEAPNVGRRIQVQPSEGSPWRGTVRDEVEIDGVRSYILETGSIVDADIATFLDDGPADGLTAEPQQASSDAVAAMEGVAQGEIAAGSPLPDVAFPAAPGRATPIDQVSAELPGQVMSPAGLDPVGPVYSATLRDGTEIEAVSVDTSQEGTATFTQTDGSTRAVAFPDLTEMTVTPLDGTAAAPFSQNNQRFTGLRQAVRSHNSAPRTGRQWIDSLRRTRGANYLETSLTGLDTWLENTPDQVSRRSIENYIDANTLGVDRVANPENPNAHLYSMFRSFDGGTRNRTMTEFSGRHIGSFRGKPVFNIDDISAPARRTKRPPQGTTWDQISFRNLLRQLIEDGYSQITWDRQNQRLNEAAQASTGLLRRYNARLQQSRIGEQEVNRINITPGLRDAVLAADMPLAQINERARSPLRNVTADAGRILQEVSPQNTIQSTPDSVHTGGTAGANWGRILRVATDGLDQSPGQPEHGRSFQFLRQNGFFTSDEDAILSAAVPHLRPVVRNQLEDMGTWTPDQIDNHLQNPDNVLAEAAAHYRALAAEDMVSAELAELRGLNTAQRRGLGRSFERMRNFFERLRNALRGRGFRSSSDIFESVQSGAVANRRPDFRSPSNRSTQKLYAWQARMADAAFQEFLADTTVVDNAGNPLQVYAGHTQARADAFNPDQVGVGRDFGPAAAYVTSNPQHAARLAGTLSENELNRVWDELNAARGELDGTREIARALRDQPPPEYTPEQAETEAQRLDAYAEELVQQIDHLESIIPNDAYAHNMEPVYANIENPLDTSLPIRNEDIADVARLMEEFLVPDGLRQEALDALRASSTLREAQLAHPPLGIYIGAMARRRGHDGIHFMLGRNVDDETQHAWVAFRDDQLARAQEAQETAQVRRDIKSTEDALNSVQNIDFRELDGNDIRSMSGLVFTSRHLAATQAEFTPVYSAIENMRGTRSMLMEQAALSLRPYTRLDSRSRRNVHAALEIADFRGMRLEPNRNGVYAIMNEDTATAKLSQPGDAIILTQEESQAYAGVQEAMNGIFENIKQSFLHNQRDFQVDSLGIQFRLDPENTSIAQVNSIMEELQNTRRLLAESDPEGTNVAQQLRELDDVIGRLQYVGRYLADHEASMDRDYIPHFRFGEYGIPVLDEAGNLLHLEDVEGIRTARGFRKNRAKLQQRMRELQDQYPEARVGEPFRLTADEIRARTNQNENYRTLMDFDLIMSRLGEEDSLSSTVQDVRNQLEDEINRRGMAAHMRRRSNIPGYSTDFDRALASYIAGAAGFSARTRHQNQLQDALTQIDPRHRQLYRFAKKYADYNMSPQEEYSFLRQIGFTWYLGMNQSSALLQALSIPQFLWADTAKLTSTGNATTSIVSSMKDVYKIMGATTLHWLRNPLHHYESGNPVDVSSEIARATLTKEEFDLLNQIGQEGHTRSLATVEQQGLTQQRSGLQREFGSTFSKVTDVMATMFNMMEVSSRMVGALATIRAYNKDPALLQRAMDTYADNPLFTQRMGSNPNIKDLAIFQIQENFGDYGKLNRAGYARHAGAPIFQFTSWSQQMVEKMARNMKREGPAGRKAFALTAIMLGIAGGAFSTFFMGDILDFSEYAWNASPGTAGELDIRREIRTMMNETAGNKWMSEAVLNGLSRFTGVDLSVRGTLTQFPASDIAKTLLGMNTSPGDALGLPGSLLIDSPHNMGERIQHGESPWRAAREIYPTFLRNIIEGAFLWPREGVRTRSGATVIPPEEVSLGESLTKVVGFTPGRIAMEQDKNFAQTRYIQHVTERGSDLRGRLIRNREEALRAQMEGDTERLAAAREERQEIISDWRERNASLPPQDRITFDDDAIYRQAIYNIFPEQRIREAPTQTRHYIWDEIMTLNPLRDRPTPAEGR